MLHAYINLIFPSYLSQINLDATTPDEDKTRPMYWAVREGHVAAVKILLDEGAVIKPLNSYQDSATFVATMHMQPSVLQLLIDKGHTTGKNKYWI